MGTHAHVKAGHAIGQLAGAAGKRLSLCMA
jgi:hypothetical protein